MTEDQYQKSLLERFKPICNVTYFAYLPPIDKTLSTYFYYVIMDLQYSEFNREWKYKLHEEENTLDEFNYEPYECILHVSKDGYKCMSKHSVNNQCGNSKYLNYNFTNSSILNKLYLFYATDYNLRKKVIDYDFYLKYSDNMLYKLLIRPIFYLLYVFMLYSNLFRYYIYTSSRMWFNNIKLRQLKRIFRFIRISIFRLINRRFLRSIAVVCT